ncbi:MAG: recombinase family protein [Lachnospiraceae bacterium]|nr:recombinase family protein [Lachnospiraceae bacterium]
MSDIKESGLPEQERIITRDHYSMTRQKSVKKLTVSPPKTDEKESEAAVKKRVAAYCRVSTEEDCQLSSFQIQMGSLRDQIEKHEGWELVDVYADRGASGTRADRRENFNRMIADCEAGKIDYIITKSISRFARNTVECLAYVRQLKERGVFVYFEKEGLDTGDEASEIVLSIMAAVAQEESRNLSENYKWAYQKRSEAGKAKWSQTYGYMKDGDEPFVPDPGTAPIVRRIFDEYYHGRSLPEIVAWLTEDNVPTARGGKWTPTQVQHILCNEKYVGDVICQKTYVADYMSHRLVRNRGEKPTYYIRDHHEPIVDRDVYEAVQKIRELKDLHTGAVQYPYGGLLTCPICGKKMVRNLLKRTHWPAGWHCPPENGNTVCAGYYIDETYIDNALRQAYRELDMDALRRQVNKRDTEIVARAEEAIRMKEEMPELGKIEYYFLKEMVESIEFRKWELIVIQWKCGLKSNVEVKYTKLCDIPCSKWQLATRQSKRWVQIAEEAAKKKEDEQNED